MGVFEIGGKGVNIGNIIAIRNVIMDNGIVVKRGRWRIGMKDGWMICMHVDNGCVVIGVVR